MATSDPTQAQGAQIPLPSFNIPEFPPSARGLRALTLTSEIPQADYQSILTAPFSVPALPGGIESLTLELFSLGYPSTFLSALAERLPNLKSVVVYSQIISGTSTKTQDDAVLCFKRLQGLRALHLLDVFAQPGFFKDVGPWVKWNTSDAPGEARRGLMFLEVNYTYRPEDEDFMSKIQASELPHLIGPGLISLSLNLSSPESSSDDAQPDDSSADGIMSFNSTTSTSLVTALTGEETYPRGLRALNTTIYTFSLEQLREVLKVQKNVMVLNVTVDATPGEAWKRGVLEVLEGCKNLEQVEIVASPSMELFMELQSPSTSVLSRTFPAAADIADLSKKLEKLASFKANVMRSTQFARVEWARKDGVWTGGVKAAA